MNSIRTHRQAYLLVKYKFKCTCPACADGSPESDQARTKVILASARNRCRDESALVNWLYDRSKPDDLIISECLVMINILEQAKLSSYPALWPVWYQHLVKASCALENKKNARKWAEKAAKLARTAVFHDAGWDAVAKEPDNTNWWGLRTRARDGIHLEEELGNIQFRRYPENMEDIAPMGFVVWTCGLHRIRSSCHSIAH